MEMQTVEITGAPCSGKTTFAQKQFQGDNLLLGAMPLSYKSSKRFCCSFFLCFYSLLSGALKVRQLLWLTQMALRYDESLISRTNAYRNALTKFGYRYFETNERLNIIDEGISHIPFILGLSYREIDNFVKLFETHLKHIHILFVEAPPNKMLVKRLMKRGHKRVKTSEMVETFIRHNLKIANAYKEILCKNTIDVTYINLF
jgi:broad-specificity NMP kinase